MKKLMSLMVVCAAAFAGGGLLNEHNLTTAINYLYHKQQIGKVISLGSITGTPPAELPDSIPNVPGAVVVQNPNAPNLMQNSSQISNDPSLAGNVAQPNPPVTHGNPSESAAPSAQPVVPPPPLDKQTAFEPTPIPATPPPPLSIHWPNEAPKNYRAVSIDPSRQVNGGMDQSGVPKPDSSAVSKNLPPKSDFIPPAELTEGHPPVAALPKEQPGFKANVPETRDPIASTQPRRDDDLYLANLNSRPGELRNPSQGLSGNESRELSWNDLMEKMKAKGIRNVQMTATPGGNLKLRCELPIEGTVRYQVIEAEGNSPQAAAKLALNRATLYTVSRRVASQSSQPDPSVNASYSQDAHHAEQPNASGPSATELPTPVMDSLPPPAPADAPQ